MGAAALVHKGVKSPEDFNAGPEVWVNTLTSDTGTQAPGNELLDGLEPELNPMSDRVLSTRVQSFSSIVHRFTYEASRMTGYVEVAGSPPAVSKSSSWRPLRTRQALAAATAVGLALASLLLMGSYGAQHAWYAAYGSGGWIALTGFAAALSSATVVAGLLLPRRLWSNARVWVPLGLVGVAAACFGVVWKVAGPTAGGAQRALAEHNNIRAEVEANALRDLNIDPKAGAEVLDDLHLGRLREATTFDQIASIASEPWNTDERRKVALGAVKAVAEEKMGELYASKNRPALVSLSKSIGEFDPAMRDNLAAHASLVRADQCIPQKDCSCVVESLKGLAAAEGLKSEVTRVHDTAVIAFAAAIKELAASASSAPASDPHQRQAALKQALDLAKCYADLAAIPSDPNPAALEALLAPVNREVETADKKTAALAAAEEAKRKRAAAVEEAKRKQQDAIDQARRRQADAVAAAQQAAEDQAQRAANRSLVCRDGSTSGCSCAGSHRGCCSHHGGVAGCEPL